jgi:hypothetical protein
VSELHNALDAAINDVYRADGGTGHIAGWVCAVVTIGNDGVNDTTGTMIMYPNGSMPWHIALGIMEAARLRMHADFVDGAD